MKLSIPVLILASGVCYAATEEHVARTFPATSGGTLIVDVDFGSIDVDTNATPGEISVDVWRKVARKTTAEEQRYFRESPVQFSAEGSKLKVECRSRVRNPVSGNNRNEAKYTIRVPAEFSTRLDTSGGDISVTHLAGNTQANTSGGQLHFSGLRGPLTGHTSGGDVFLADCDGKARIRTSGGRIDASSGGGSLDAETSGGDVSLKTFNGPATVETSGGSITLVKVGGKLQASTSGGPISLIMNSPVPGEVSLSTSGGEVTLQAPEKAAFNLNAHTSAGRVSCDLPVTIEGKVEEGKLKGMVNGGGPEVVLRSRGGDIRVEKLD